MGMMFPKAFLDEFTESMGELAYNLCFNVSEAYVDKDRRKVVVLTDNEYMYNLIRDSFLDKLLELTKEYFGEDWDVDIRYHKKKTTGADGLGLRDSTEYAPEANKQLSHIPYSTLNPRYTFDNFVTGSGNQFAYAAALAVAQAVVQGSQKTYNPLFIYGKAGLGKTHLMQAIGNYIVKRVNNVVVLYSSTEKFTNELINALKERKLEEFHRKYRNVDVLLLDDVQFIAGKERTQEELFHTFNELYDRSKQIVIASDRPPKSIYLLEERLRSRFESGLIVDVQPPDFETRKAILRKKIELEKNLLVEEEVIDYIAQHFRNNVRELEGALIRVIAFANTRSLSDPTVVTLDIAMEALSDMIGDRSKELTPARIKESVAEYFGITLDELVSPSREKRLLYPRQIAMYLMRDLLGMSFKQIGEEFGGKDHSTVMYSYQKIKKQLSNQKVHNDLKNIKGKLLDESV